MKEGAVRSLVNSIQAACVLAETTGRNQFVPVPRTRMAELGEAERRVFSTDFSWLRKCVRTSTGLRIEVLESYAESKGVPP